MMTAMKRMMSCALVLFALALCLQRPAKAQIAYTPEIGVIPSGVTMTITPAVSADRRYVRLSVNAFFNNLNNIQTFSFPGGAVGGNFGGGFGGFGAGAAAGMNGVIGDEGYESGVQVGNGMNVAAQAQAPVRPPGPGRAGPLPGDQAAFGGDPLQNGAGIGQGQWGEFGFMPGFEDEAALMMAMENGPGRGVRSAGGGAGRSPRRSARKSTRSSHRPSGSAQRKGRVSPGATANPER
jgi:hypothetical protein